MGDTYVTIKFQRRPVSADFIELLNTTFANAGYTPIETARLVLRKGFPRHDNGIPWKDVSTFLCQGQSVTISFDSGKAVIRVRFDYYDDLSCEELFLNCGIGSDWIDYSPKTKALLLVLEKLAFDCIKSLKRTVRKPFKR